MDQVYELQEFSYEIGTVIVADSTAKYLGAGKVVGIGAFSRRLPHHLPAR